MTCYSVVTQQEPEGNRGGRSNTQTQRKDIRGSFTLIDQHSGWEKGLPESAGEIRWENKRTAACRSVRQPDKKLMIDETSDDLKEELSLSG